MGGDITIDFGSALPYLEDRIRGLFHRDTLTVDFFESLRRVLEIAEVEAATVQCIGMPEPIPIRNIYQSTKLRYLAQVITFDQILEKLAEDLQNPPPSTLRTDNGATIFAGPGCGKSTLLHWEFLAHRKDAMWLPILFTLRWPGAIEDLTTFVRGLETGTSLKRLSRGHVLLLVDGYDEVASEDRRRVSVLLRAFSTLNIGVFVLTCRQHYHIHDLRTKHYLISDFERDDSLKFIDSFSKAYGSALNPNALLKELNDRGFASFAAQPLLLALICILKTGPMPSLPRNAIGLLRRALETLTIRWDEVKGIARDTRILLDGDERVRCLMRVAFNAKLIENEEQIYRIVREHLRLVQRENIDIGALLNEMAQWFGILVPTADCHWCFTHRTLWDYLAARFWVESGQFRSHDVDEWDARATYAACLIPDATEAAMNTLRKSVNLNAFSEMLCNAVPFDVGRIAEALWRRFERLPGSFEHRVHAGTLYLESHTDIFSLASSQFLSAVVSVAAQKQGRAADCLIGCAVAELLSRGSPVPQGTINMTWSEEFHSMEVTLPRGKSRLSLAAWSTFPVSSEPNL